MREGETYRDENQDIEESTIGAYNWTDQEAQRKLDECA